MYKCVFYCYSTMSVFCTQSYLIPIKNICSIHIWIFYTHLDIEMSHSSNEISPKNSVWGLNDLRTNVYILTNLFKMVEHIRSLKRTIDSNLKNQLADIALAPQCRCHRHTGTSVPRSCHNAPSLQPRAQQRNKTTRHMAIKGNSQRHLLKTMLMH
jgi:hypothetical protein